PGLPAPSAAPFLPARGAGAVVARPACTSHPVVVNVAAAGEIEPVVRHLGQYFNRLHRQVDGRCVHVAVTAEPPGAVAAQLAGTAPRRGPRAAARGPDSSLGARSADRAAA